MIGTIGSAGSRASRSVNAASRPADGKTPSVQIATSPVAERSRVREFRKRLGALGVPLKPLDFPVVAFELDPPTRMRRVHEAALKENVFLPLIHYAGSGPNGFFRIVWNAAHTDNDLERLIEVLGRALESA